MPAFKAASIKGFVPAFVRSAEEMVGVLTAVEGRAYGGWRCVVLRCVMAWVACAVNL
jgi:hypothetical protein